MMRRRRTSYKAKFSRKHTYGRFIPGGEVKSMDPYDGATVGFTSGGANVATWLLLNAPTTGAAFWNRVGARIRLKSIDINIWPYTTASTAPTVGSVYKMILLYDSQTNGAYPSTGDVLSSWSAGGIQSTQATSGLNPVNRDRFLVLRTWSWTSPGVATPAGGASVTSGLMGRLPKRIHWFVKLNGMETVFKASTNAIGDIATGALLMMFIAEDGSPASQVDASFSARLRFMD